MGHGVGSIVGKGEENILNSEGLANLLCLSMEGEQGFSNGIVLHFDICPLNTVSKPPPNGFEESFLCREPDGKTFWRPRLLLAPDDLFLCKDSVQKRPPQRVIRRSIRSIFTISIPVPIITTKVRNHSFGVRGTQFINCWEFQSFLVIHSELKTLI